MRLSCGICQCTTSPHCPPERVDRDFVAITDCGHIYHQSCLNTWYHTSNEKGCPTRCTYLNVKRDNPNRNMPSRRQEPLPFLTLFPTGEKGDAPSSDQPDASQEAAEPARKKRKLMKARAVVPDDEGDEAPDGTQSESDASQGAANVDEVTTLRNQLRQAMQTVREQRVALAGLRTTVDELRAAAPAPQQRARRDEPPGFDYDLCSDEDRYSDYDDDDDWFGASARRHPYGRDYDEQGNCKRCGVQHDAVEELEDLRATVEAYEEDLETAISADEFARVQERLASLQSRHDELLARYNELDSDYRTDKIAWQDEKQKLMRKLRESGDSGQEMIKELQAEVDKRDRELLHINASIDGIRKVAQDEVKAAQQQAQRAEKSAIDTRVAAKQSVRDAEAKLKQEEEKRRRVEGANKRYEADLVRLKRKIAELRAKRGIVATESDAEDFDPTEGPHTSFPSRQFKRTASSRSYQSPSPPSDGPTFKVNNYSKLLASPTKKQHERTPMDDCEVSREYSDGEDDELEYADVETMRAAAREAQRLKEMEDKAPARPVPDRNDDDSSDVEVVESSYFAASSARTKQKAPARPLSAHNSLPNASSSTSSAHLSAKQPSPFPSLVPAKTAAATPKEQALAKSSSDKWLPKFASSQAILTGPKRSVKRR